MFYQVTQQNYSILPTSARGYSNDCWFAIHASPEHASLFKDSDTK